MAYWFTVFLKTAVIVTSEVTVFPAGTPSQLTNSTVCPVTSLIEAVTFSVPMVISASLIEIADPDATVTDGLSTTPSSDSLTPNVTVKFVGAAVPQTAYRVTFDLTSMESVNFAAVALGSSDQPRNVLDASGNVSPVPSGRGTFPYATIGSTVPVPPFRLNVTSYTERLMLPTTVEVIPAFNTIRSLYTPAVSFPVAEGLPSSSSPPNGLNFPVKTLPAIVVEYVPPVTPDALRIN